MAKEKRSGLGRGLNSLLGGAFDEAIPAAPAPRTQVERPAPTPRVERQKNEDERAAEADQRAKGDMSVVAEDNVTIKGVVPREARPARSVASAQPEVQPMAQRSEPRLVQMAQPQQQPKERIVVKEVIKEVAKDGADEVLIDQVKPNPDQPRTFFKKEDLEELAASIEKDGLLQPILVRKMGENSYQIIAGERRWQACKSIGLKKVPIRVKKADDAQALELALIENIQRADLNPIEEAYGYRRLMDRKKLTQAELAQMLSKGRSTIANALRLLDLPEDAQQLLFEEKITAGHARAILAVPTAEGRQKLTEKLINEKLSVRETESIARLLAARPEPSQSKPRVATPKSFKVVARNLRKQLATNVRVKTVQGKNKIEIEFKDEEELQRIFEQLSNKN